MHEPIGLSGVQALPNSLQSVGFFTPRKIAGHLQLFTSATLRGLSAKRFSASKAANGSLILSAL